jgi:hypothetical protein
MSIPKKKTNCYKDIQIDLQESSSIYGRQLLEVVIINI